MKTQIKTWTLDTGNAGCDEHGLKGTYEEVLQDILNHHEMESLPEDWVLIPDHNA